MGNDFHICAVRLPKPSKLSVLNRTELQANRMRAPRLNAPALWGRFGLESAIRYLATFGSGQARLDASPSANKWVVTHRSHQEVLMKKKIVGIGLTLSLLALCSSVSNACLLDPGPPCAGYGCRGFESAKSSQPKSSQNRKSKSDRNAQAATDPDSSAASNASR